MWDRKDIKAKGKAAYGANKFMCIIAAFLLTLACGGGIGGISTPSLGSSDSQAADASVDTSGLSGDMPSEFLDLFTNPIVIGFGIGIMLMIIAMSMLITALLLNPILVGVKKFFIQNATDSATGLSGDNIGLAFSNNWSKVVASIFTTQLMVFLWSLLLIVPGVIKAYEWRMVSFIVSEDPTISGKEARDLSSKMMSGNKWAAFVFDLSFLGWQFLGICTFGILNLVFTNPYKAASDAELYLTLAGRPSQTPAQG